MVQSTQQFEILVWPIDRLVPYARNPRKNDAAVDRMCGSIREFGFKIPVLARSDGSYQIAQAMASHGRMPISEQTLRHRLRQRNLLASVDQGRHVLLVRRTLEHRPRQVLHLRASDLLQAKR